ncbi:MAG: hypothetical protein ACXVAB_15890 [Thermodesulfobacteriota bacterium]
MRKILVVLALILILAITFASFGIAYAGGIRGIGLLGVCFFFTGGIIVVLGQLIPAGILISSFVGTVISSFRKGELPIRAT